MPRASPAPKPNKNASPTEPAVSFSNPASLLWAKQIKREHAFLLERMKAAEAQVQTSNSRVKAAEAAAETVKDIARKFQCVTERLSALEETSTRIQDTIMQCKDTEKELSHIHKLQDMVVSLQSRLDDFEIGYRQSSNKSKTILDKMEVLRTALTREFQQRDDKIVKKNDPADIRVLSGRLDAIEGLQRKEATERKAVNDRLEDIQRTLIMQFGRVELPEDPLHTPTQQRDKALGDLSIGVALRQTQTPAAQIQVPASPWSSSSILSEGVATNPGPLLPSTRRERLMEYTVTQVPPISQAPHSSSRYNTPDLDAPYRQTTVEPANTSRKRRLCSPKKPAQKRSRPKTQGNRKGDRAPAPSLIVVLKVPVKDSQSNQPNAKGITVETKTVSKGQPIHPMFQQLRSASPAARNTQSMAKKRMPAVPSAVLIPEGHPLKRKWVRRDLSNWN